MALHDPLRDLELLIRSRYALIAAPSNDEPRIVALLARLTNRLGVPLFRWSRTSGLARDGAAGNAVYGTRDLAGALGHIASSSIGAVYLLAPSEDELRDPAVADRLREAAVPLSERAGAIVLTGPSVELPEVLRPIAGRFVLPAPSAAEYRALAEQVVKSLGTRMPVRVRLSAQDLQALLDALRGLTLVEAEKVLTRAIVEDGLLSADDIEAVAVAKKDLVERDGLLEYIATNERMEDIADLAALKDWLSKRQLLLADPSRAAEYGLSFPKGVLLVGVPGCGKSLCAKAVAAAWRMPLLKLDPGALYSKWVGETEKNFRRALETAERLAPLVLWIDEIEKAFASGGSEDGGVSQRVLGSFLSWMQDRKGDVFTVATANDVSKLPPELLRKGRFDELFFVDLPDEPSREAILRIHLARRKQAPERFDLAALAAATEGYSPAELEQAIVSALYTAFSRKVALTTELIRDELAGTPPVSRTMAERIAAVREWAQGRTVPAN